MPRARNDILGKTFGVNKVMSDVGMGSDKSIIYECKCQKCGRIKLYRSTDLNKGRGSSCICQSLPLLLAASRSRSRTTKPCLCRLCGEKDPSFFSYHRKSLCNECAKKKEMGKYYERGGYECQKERESNYIDTLSDRYLKNKLRTRYGLKSNQITDEMIQLKRGQLKLYRQLKKIKKEVGHGVD